MTWKQLVILIWCSALCLSSATLAQEQRTIYSFDDPPLQAVAAKDKLPARNIFQADQSLLLPDVDSSLITLYAPAKQRVRLVCPIRYCYERLPASGITHTVYDELQPVGEIAKPTSGQAELKINRLEFVEGGQVLIVEFDMPQNVGSLQVWYYVSLSTPRWGPSRHARRVDIHLVPKDRTFAQWVESLR